jgi:TolB-like protein/tetratricopeptide (TPR) repeat protein
LLWIKNNQKHGLYMADSIFTELKRRNVFKVGVAYLVLAWVVVQVTDTAVPALHLPEWINSAVFFFGLIGFPFAIFFAWAFEITPDGVMRESEVASDHSITRSTGNQLNYVTIGLLIIGMGYFFWESRYSTVTEQEAVSDTSSGLAEESSPAKDMTSTKDVQNETSNPSIAVLPFVNMSSDPEQEYFSDGISEELLNLLAKIPQLQVAARTSSFQFKGKNQDIQQIAKQLGVKTVLEGSIRKSGTKVRITAQLIKADDGFHMWSETYDRELTDVFAVQDEISAAIVNSLKDTLGVELTINKPELIRVLAEAHDYYLRGLQGLNTSTFSSLKDAQSFFQKAIDPTFIQAKIELARSIFAQFNTGSISDKGRLDEAEIILYQVLQAEPSSADAYYHLSNIENINNKIKLSKEHFIHAFKLDPNSVLAIEFYATFIQYGRMGELFTEETLTPLYEAAIARDPLNAELYYAWGIINAEQFQNYKIAEKSYIRSMELASDNGNPPFYLSILAESALGDLVKSIKYLKVALKADASDPDGPIALSESFLSLGALEQATNYANVAIKISPTSAHAIKVIVETLLFQGKFKEAQNLAIDTLNNDKYFYRRFAKFDLVSAAVFVFLKEQKYEEAQAILFKHFPKVEALLNAPLPKTVAEIGFPVTLYAAILRASGDTKGEKRLLERMTLMTEEYFQKSKPALDGLDYVLLAAMGGGLNTDEVTINYLNKMYDAGYVTNWRNILLWSPEFIYLQEHPDFIALVARIEKNMTRQRAFVEE